MGRAPVHIDVRPGDFVTVGLLVILEGLLSADNALVMAMLVLGLPREQHGKALRYGLVGAFAFRTVATLLAAWLIRVTWVKLGGAVYLAYLTIEHFRGGADDQARRTVPPARARFGLSPLWATVVNVEVVNLAFSLDSILVAVAMSPRRWVVLTGGLLGIAAMRFVVAQLLEIVRRYPVLVDGAFVIIGWVAVKLGIDYLYAAAWIGWSIPQPLSLAVIAAIFLSFYVVARRGGRPPDTRVQSRET